MSGPPPFDIDMSMDVEESGLDTTTILLIGLLVLLIGIGIYFYYSKDSEPEESTNDDSNTEEQTSNEESEPEPQTTIPAVDNTLASPYILPKYSINVCEYILNIICLQPNLIHYINTTPSGLFYKFEDQDKTHGLIKKNNNNLAILYPRKSSDNTFPHPHGCGPDSTTELPECISTECKKQLPSLELGKTVENPVTIPTDGCKNVINYIIVRPHLVHIIKTNNAGLYCKIGQNDTIHRFKKVNNNIVFYEKQSDGKRNTPSTDPQCIREIPNCTLTSTQDGSFQKPIILNVDPMNISDVFSEITDNHLNKFTSTNNCFYCKYNTSPLPTTTPPLTSSTVTTNMKTTFTTADNAEVTIITGSMLLRIQKLSNTVYTCSEMFYQKRTFYYDAEALISTSSNKLNLAQIEKFNNTIRNLPVPFYMQFIDRNNEKIIYKRLTPVGDWNFFRLLHYDWFGCEEPGKCSHGSGEDNKPPLIENKAISNTMNTDFKLFSNLNDAKTDTNAWKFCNFNDATVGFPRDCGPTGVIGNRWMRYYPGKTGTNTPFRWELVI
jgi:hypothetical protein